jgi:hypothetical protein
VGSAALMLKGNDVDFISLFTYVGIRGADNNKFYHFWKNILFTLRLLASWVLLSKNYTIKLHCLKFGNGKFKVSGLPKKINTWKPME